MDLITLENLALSRTEDWILRYLENEIQSGGVRPEDLGSAFFEDFRKKVSDLANLGRHLEDGRLDAEELQRQAVVLLGVLESLEKTSGDVFSAIRKLAQSFEANLQQIWVLVRAMEAQRWASGIPSLPAGLRVVQDLISGTGVLSGRPRTVPAAVPYRSYRPDGKEMMPEQRSIVIKDRGVFRGLSIERSRDLEIVPATLFWRHSLQDLALAEEVFYSEDSASIEVLLKNEDPAGQVDSMVLLPQGQNARDLLDVWIEPGAVRIPIFVRIRFLARRSFFRYDVSVYDIPYDPIEISRYNVDRENLFVLSNGELLEEGVHYELDPNNFRLVRLKPAASGKSITFLFTEYFPAYQCSVNNEDWSSPVFLDESRPFAGDLEPIPGFSVMDGRFPVLEENGKFSGIRFRFKDAVIGQEYLFRFSRASSRRRGFPVTLEIELERAAYVNELVLTPEMKYPVRLYKISSEGLVTQSNQEPSTLFFSPSGVDIGEGEVSIPLFIESGSSREVPYVRKLFIELEQMNYLLKEQTPEDDEYRARILWSGVQQMFQNLFPAPAFQETDRLFGRQYKIAFRGIRIRRMSEYRGPATGSNIPVVLVFGPYRNDARFSAIRVDLDGYRTGIADVQCFLSVDFLDASGAVVAQRNDTAVIQGTTFSRSEAWPDLASLPPAAVRADLYLKIVILNPESVVSRFLFQVA